MKKLLSLVLLSIFALQTIVLADVTDYEKKLEYHRKKIEIKVRTDYIGESETYNSSDTSIFGYATTTESNTYLMGNASTTGSSNTRNYTKQITDWYIMKGGIMELSDQEFVEEIGDKVMLSNIQKQTDDKGRYLVWGIGSAVLGVGAIVAAASQTPVQPALSGAGTLLVLTGIVLTYLSAPPRHYIRPDYAMEKSDKYNISLKKTLGLPIETE